ncbi:MAG: hypothetical protein J6A37_14630 [Oscillospiraceae bacterium]|nr:hypothetical protein [Oscillospiraceae bacterium]
MDDIIKSIIDIDRGTTKRIEDAERQKMKIIEEAKAEEEKIIARAIKVKNSELEKLEKLEMDKTNERIAQLSAEKNCKIEAMTKSFEKNSEKWCEEIFRAVISV